MEQINEYRDDPIVYAQVPLVRPAAPMDEALAALGEALEGIGVRDFDWGRYWPKGDDEPTGEVRFYSVEAVRCLTNRIEGWR